MRLFELQDTDKEQQINTYLSQFNDEIDRWIGAGDSGDAYLTKKGNLIKQTNSENELKNSLNQMKKKNPYFVTIYDATKLPTGEHYIYQEFLDTSNVGSVISRISKATNHKYSDTQLEEVIDVLTKIKQETGESLYPKLDSELQEYVKALMGITKTANLIGMNEPDLHDENLGQRKDGSFALFDLMDLDP